MQRQTSIGKAIAKILGFNDGGRLFEGQALASVGRYPPVKATERMN